MTQLTPDQAPAAPQPTSRLQEIIDEANNPSLPLIVGQEPAAPATSPNLGAPEQPMAPAPANLPTTGSRFKDMLRDANADTVPVFMGRSRGLTDVALKGAGVTTIPEISARRLPAKTPDQLPPAA